MARVMYGLLTTSPFRLPTDPGPLAIYYPPPVPIIDAARFAEVHDKQYALAREVPICNGRLFDDFGYVAKNPASRAVLDGTYQAPANSDIATKELFDKIAAIRRIIPKDLAPIIITPEQWKRYWAIVNEETLSSESGLHFGHYIIGCNSNIVAH
jgi:hypothetical protein